MVEYLGGLRDPAVNDMVELGVEVLGDELRDELAERGRLLGGLEDGRVPRCNGANLYPLCEPSSTLETRLEGL